MSRKARETEGRLVIAWGCGLRQEFTVNGTGILMGQWKCSKQNRDDGYLTWQVY